MLAGRGVAVLATGLLMWLAARLIGSPGLEVVAIGIAALPFVAAGAARRGARNPWCIAASRTSASRLGHGCT
jgi:hypothetical protein